MKKFPHINEKGPFKFSERMPDGSLRQISDEEAKRLKLDLKYRLSR